MGQGQPQRRGAPSAQDAGSTAGQDDLAVTLSELARTLQQQDDPHETLVGIVAAAVELIPGAEEGSISVVLNRRHVTSEAPSGQLAVAVDALQDATGQGPCLDAAYQQETVRVTDMTGESRWPQFTRAALAAGAAAMLSFQLYVQGDNLGALNLYARHAGAFNDDSEHIGLLFASHAAIAYAAVRKQTGLTRSIATRQEIGQAQGILMERYRLNADAAFAVLVRTSQQTNTKLRDLAAHLVRSGELSQPAGPAPGPGPASPPAEG